MTSRRRLAALAAGAVMTIGAAACGGETATNSGAVIEVTDAVVAEPAGAHTAAYLSITNRGSASDQLVEVRSDAGERIELHETQAGDDGLMRMVEQPSIAIPARSTVELVPGGLHVMIFDTRPLAADDIVTLELEFERVGTVEVEARVRPYSETFDD